MALMTSNVRKPVLTLGILTALIGLLSAGCSSSDSEAAVVQPTAIAEPVTDTQTSEKAEDRSLSGTATPQPEPIAEDVSARAQVGEDTFVAEDRSETTVAEPAATPIEIEIGRPYGEDGSQIAGWSTYHDSGSSSTTANDSAIVTEIPVPFQGTWDAGVEPCSVPSDGRLSLEPDYIRFYESSGPVTEVVVHGDSKITISADLFGEGEYYTSTNTFELSEDGLSLTDTTNDDYDFVRSRCQDL